jgi:hypothetical protein
LPTSFACLTQSAVFAAALRLLPSTHLPSQTCQCQGCSRRRIRFKRSARWPRCATIGSLFIIASPQRARMNKSNSPRPTMSSGWSARLASARNQGPQLRRGRSHNLDCDLFKQCGHGTEAFTDFGGGCGPGTGATLRPTSAANRTQPRSTGLINFMIQTNGLRLVAPEYILELPLS